LADGNSPYSRAYQPAMMDVYPPLYNLLVLPFSVVFGNTLEVHRAVSAFLILASCVMVGWVVWRRGGDIVFGAAAAVLLYAGLIFYSTSFASTNALGVFLFLSTLVIPWWRKFTTGSLLVAAVVGVLAFYAKQYFILGGAILCLYLFLYVSMLRGVLLGCAFVLLLSVSLSLVHLGNPYFMDNVLFSSGDAMSSLRDWRLVPMQAGEYLLIYGGLLAGLAIAMAFRFRQSGLPHMGRLFATKLELDLGGLTKPMLKSPVDYYWFGFFWASAAIVLVLSQNPGNYMTYWFQLMSPFLLIGSFSSLATSQGHRWLLLLVFFSFYQAWAFLPKDFSYTEDNWQRVDKIVADSDEVLATQLLLMSLLKHNKTVYQNGHSSYFPFAFSKPDIFRKGDPEQQVEAVWNNYKRDLYLKVANREFDTIIVSAAEINGIFNIPPYPNEAKDGRKFLSRYYYVAEKFPLSISNRFGGGTFYIRVWRPRTDVIADDATAT
jgi:hypothetical protein